MNEEVPAIFFAVRNPNLGSHIAQPIMNWTHIQAPIPQPPGRRLAAASSARFSESAGEALDASDGEQIV